MPYKAPTQARQRAAVACEECRRRKLRCDGQQPSCGVCQESGSVCEFIQRSTRGPKKGYVKALKNRLVHMETLLGSKNEARQEVHRQQGITVDGSVPLVEYSDIAMVEEAPSWLPTVNDLGTTMSNGVLPELASTYEWTMTPDLSKATNGELNLSENMQAELDQLYFDRVHPSIPILNQRRYLSLRNRNLESPSRKCVQYSIWMLASLMSTQFRAIIEPLYHKTKQMLESLSVSGSEKGNSSDLELLQAWVLLATYESMRAFHREAWISAGWSFRFVQGLHYHELDRPGEAPDSEDWVKTEEKRRVFWMAYLLDHLFSMRNNWPITLNEHVICTRLPCTETEFQSGKHTRGDFLSEAMTRPKEQTQSTFNECIILATIAGRGLLNGQKRRIFEAYGDNAGESEWQRQWLDKILDARLHALPGNYPPPTEAYDPLLMFAHVLAQATVVYFCKGMLSQRPKPTGELNGPSFGALEYEIRVLAAMNSMFQIASELTNLHFSKVHPLMHIPLFMTAEFLYENLSTHESFHSCLAELTDILRKLKNVNSLEQSYLDLLPQSCVAKSAELLNHTTRRSSSTLPLL